MARVLVIRTSAFGDVALLVPVIYSIAARYPQDRFTVMTRQAYTPLFDHLGFNINVLPLDLRKKHGGIFGIFKIIGKVFGRYSHVVDVHDVIRSKAVRYTMRLGFSRVAKIDKGRAEKELMTIDKNTDVALKHTTQRYLDTFAKLGFTAEITFHNLYDFKPRRFELLKSVIEEKKGTWIGIAPFAKHQGKIYPLDQMEKVIEKLSERENTSLFLFGAGKKELKTIHSWIKKYPNIVKHDGLLNFERELLLISYLDVMLTMDSANMHLASLVEVPVVSTWGATHPALGFYGFGQDEDNIVQHKLDCRPCSVYGNTPCQFGGEEAYKCMKLITTTEIITKIDKVLAK